MSETHDKASRFQDLTWEDVEDWAGSTIVSRGRSYQRSRAVKQLALSPSGAILAWVDGSERYSTCVDIDAEYNLSSTCTCPYWSTCKHAVAVVLTYLDQLEDGPEVPTVTEQDPRWARLQNQVDDFEDEDEDDERFEEEREDDDWEEEDDETPVVNTWQDFMAGHTKAQLIDILNDLARRFPDVRKALQDEYELAAGKVAQLVQTVRSEMIEIGAQAGWDDDGESADYSRMRGHLRELLNRGHADEVLTLGEELLQAGIEQVESSHDDGDAYEITQCMQIVFQALPHSTLSPAEQLLWAIDAQLKDDYSLCDDTEGFWDVEKPADAWSTVADELLQRLEYSPPATDDQYGSPNYRRDHLSNWIIQALEHAGRNDEIVPLCEREAEVTGSYERLVNQLQQAERWGEAEHWIRQGIDTMQERWPGIASQLREALRGMREQSGDWHQVTALRAEAFFHQPGFNTFEELRKAAEQAEVWPVVRDAAMHYLETGEHPQAPVPGAKRKAADWPLPQPDVEAPEPRWQTQFPHVEALIDIAIADNRPDEVLRWYDQGGKGPVLTRYGISYDDKVAAAVVDTHPDRVLAIWERQAEAYIAQAQVKSYEMAAGYLRRVRQLLQDQDREAAWQDYLAALRKTHRRKYRLVEILDRLNDTRTITGATSRRR